MQLLQEALARIGRGAPFAIRDETVFPRSLRQLFDVVDSPVPDLGRLDNEGNKWINYRHDEPQGIAFWQHDLFFVSYMTSVQLLRMSVENPHDFVRRFTLGFPWLNDQFDGELTDEGQAIRFDDEHYRHIGDIECRSGTLYLVVEHSDYDNRRAKPLLIAIAPVQQPLLIGYAFLEPRVRIALERVDHDYAPNFVPDYSATGCAVHPWNENLLFVPSGRDEAVHEGLGSRLFPYDISEFLAARDLGAARPLGRRLAAPLRFDKVLSLYKEDGSPDVLGAPDAAEHYAATAGRYGPPRGRSVQGVCIADSGRIYVTEGFGRGHRNWLTVYNGFTRRRYGTRRYNFEGLGDELEGLTVHETSRAVFLLVNNNTVFGEDWCDIYRYGYPGFVP